MSGAAALVVVGGGPAGLAAVRGFRAAGGTGEVVLVADEGRWPYRRPPLTKDLLRGELDPAELPMEDDGFWVAHGVRRVDARAEALDPVERVLRLDDDAPLAYEACVLATGSRATRLPVDGAGRPEVRLLRTVRDGLALREAVAGGVQRVVVVGSGFIGCEAAASLARRGVEVEVVSAEALPLASRLGDAAGARVRSWLEADGVRLRGDVRVARIDPGPVVVGDDGSRTEGDLVLLGAGIAPETTLAEGAGLAPADGGVACGTGQRTSAPGVWAAGDVAATEHPVAGRRLRVEHWGDALAQGEVAGRRAAGDATAVWDAVPGFWSQVGERTLKLRAWGDGFARATLEDRPDGGFAVWLSDEAGACVGVLTHEADDVLQHGEAMVRAGEPAPC